MKPHRLSAGAIVLRDERLLLVRYRDTAGGTYLVAPGGGVQPEESLGAAAVREVREETGVQIDTRHVLAVEDLLCVRFRMCKVWLLGVHLGAEPTPTVGAEKEGIIEARWFTRAELEAETVYPAFVKEQPWSSFLDGTWKAVALPIRTTSF